MHGRDTNMKMLLYKKSKIKAIYWNSLVKTSKKKIKTMFVHILVVCIYSLYSFMSFSFLSFLVNRVTRWNCVVSFYNDKWSILNINLKCEETTSSGWRDCLKAPQANTYNWLSVTESTCLHLLLRKAITTSDQIYKIMYKNFPH